MDINICTQCKRMSLETNFLSTYKIGKEVHGELKTPLKAGVCRVCDSTYHLKNSERVSKKFQSFLRKYPSASAEDIQSGYLKRFLQFLYAEYWYFEVLPVAYAEVLSFFERIPDSVVTNNQTDINYFMGLVHVATPLKF